MGSMIRMEMIKEKPKLFPVYTWHAKEADALRVKVMKLLKNPPPRATEKDIRFLGNLYHRLDGLIALLRQGDEPVAYVVEKDLVFLKKVAAWMKDHPEKQEDAGQGEPDVENYADEEAPAEDCGADEDRWSEEYTG